MILCVCVCVKFWLFSKYELVRLLVRFDWPWATASYPFLNEEKIETTPTNYHIFSKVKTPSEGNAISEVFFFVLMLQIQSVSEIK